MKSDPAARKYRRVPRVKIRPLGADEDEERNDDKREALGAVLICICEIVCITLFLVLGVGLGMAHHKRDAASPPPPPQHPPFPPDATS